LSVVKVEENVGGGVGVFVFGKEELPVEKLEEYVGGGVFGGKLVV